MLLTAPSPARATRGMPPRGAAAATRLWPLALLLQRPGRCNAPEAGAEGERLHHSSLPRCFNQSVIDSFQYIRDARTETEREFEIKLLWRGWASSDVITSIFAALCRDVLDCRLTWVDEEGEYAWAQNLYEELDKGAYNCLLDAWEIDTDNVPYQQTVVQKATVEWVGLTGISGQSSLFMTDTTYAKIKRQLPYSSPGWYEAFRDPAVLGFFPAEGTAAAMGFPPLASWSPPHCALPDSHCREVYWVQETSESETYFFESLTWTFGLNLTFQYVAKSIYDLPPIVRAMQDNGIDSLFYWWKPDPFALELGFHRVNFYGYQVGCYYDFYQKSICSFPVNHTFGRTGPDCLPSEKTECDYRVLPTQKIAATAFRRGAPVAWTLFSRIMLRTAELEDTMRSSDPALGGNETIDGAACALIHEMFATKGSKEERRQPDAASRLHEWFPDCVAGEVYSDERCWRACAPEQVVSVNGSDAQECVSCAPGSAPHPPDDPLRRCVQCADPCACGVECTTDVAGGSDCDSKCQLIVVCMIMGSIVIAVPVAVIIIKRVYGKTEKKTQKQVKEVATECAAQMVTLMMGLSDITTDWMSFIVLREEESLPSQLRLTLWVCIALATASTVFELGLNVKVAREVTRGKVADVDKARRTVLRTQAKIATAVMEDLPMAGVQLAAAIDLGKAGEAMPVLGLISFFVSGAVLGYKIHIAMDLPRQRKDLEKHLQKWQQGSKQKDAGWFTSLEKVAAPGEEMAMPPLPQPRHSPVHGAHHRAARRGSAPSGVGPALPGSPTQLIGGAAEPEGREEADPAPPPAAAARGERTSYNLTTDPGNTGSGDSGGVGAVIGAAKSQANSLSPPQAEATTGSQRSKLSNIMTS